ncbi:MAG: phosphoserine phosphatase SerB [Pseudomonadota bacterium]|nr:phosphoserine phosphatase SerB [Pseudomonadota bacterium]
MKKTLTIAIDSSSPSAEQQAGFFSQLQQSPAFLNDIQLQDAQLHVVLEETALVSTLGRSAFLGATGAKSVLTLVCSQSLTEVFGFLLHVCHQQGIAGVAVERFSTQAPVAIHLALSESVDALSTSLSAPDQANFDSCLQSSQEFSQARRLAVFDMDSTLIQAEVIDELAREIGIQDQVGEITESAMRGEIDFTESFSRRLSLLKGLESCVLDGIMARIQLTPGAQDLMAELKAKGFKTALVSGGFTYFATQFAEILGMDYVFANELDFQDGELTGQPVLPIVDSQRKAAIVAQLAAENGLLLNQVVTVGDGANDIPMLEKAGLGIAFCAKPKVQAVADQSVKQLNLSHLRYYFNA